MQRRTRKLLLILVVAPLVLGGLAAGAYVVRKAQVARSVQQSYAEGQAAFKAGDYKKALPLLGRYAGRNRDDVEAMLLLAQCRALVPKPEGTETVEAARYAESVLAKEPKNQKALELLMGYYSRLNFVTELNRVCDDLLSIDPKHLGALSAKAQALIVLGRYDDAQTVIDTLTQIDPSDTSAFRLLLEIRRLKGATPEGIAQEAGDLAERFPDRFDLHVIHAQTLMGAGQVDQGIQVLLGAASRQPSTMRGLADFLRLVDVASSLLRIRTDGSHASTIDSMRNAAKGVIESALKNPALVPGGAATATGWEWRSARLNEAKQWIERGLALSPNAPSLLAWRAILAREAGADWKADAAAVAQAETNVAPVWSPLLDALAQMDAGEWAKASTTMQSIETATRQAIAAPESGSDPAIGQRRTESLEVFVLAGYFRGFVETQQGEWRAAVQRWNASAEAEPGWSLPLVTAAQTLLERGQLESARDTALRAIRIKNGPLEALTFVRAAVAYEESQDTPSTRTDLLMNVLTELETFDAARSEALGLRARAAALRNDAPGAAAAVRGLVTLDPPAQPRDLLAAAQAVTAAGLPGADELRAAASKQAGAPEVALARANDAAAAGRTDEAITILRQAASQSKGPGAVAFRIREAQLLVGKGSRQDAIALLSAISSEFPAEASVQLDVLDQDVIWTDAAVVQSAVQRLRSATGEDGVEWKLADATRLLTFSPDPAKAQEVILRLNEIVRQFPANAQALALLSEWMMVLDDKEEAVAFLARAVEAPDAPATLYPRLIDLLRRVGRREEARAKLVEFGELQRLAPDLRRARARLFNELGFDDRAAEDLNILAAQGGVDDRLSLAGVRLARKQNDQAIEIIDAVLASPALTRDQLVSTLALLVSAGQPDRALQLIDERSTQVEPAKLALDRGKLLELAARHDDAEASLRKALQSGGGATAAVELSRFYLRRARYDDAKRTIEEARAQGLKSTEFDGLEALALAPVQPLNEAQQQAVIDSLPPGPSRELAEATRWFDAHPTEREQFVQRLRRITTADPTMLLAWQFIVKTQVELGQVDQAVASARSAAAALPAVAETARMETTTLMLAQRPADARPAAERWRALAKDSFEPTIALANVEIALNKPDAARALLGPLAAEASARSATEAQEIWLALVSALARLGDVDRAREFAALRDPAEPGLFEALVQIAGNEAQPIDAARAWLDGFRPASQDDPNKRATLAEAYASLAERSGDSSDYTTVVELMKPRLESSDATPGELIFGASMLEQTGRLPEAAPLYRRAIEKDPKQWIALNNLAYLLVKQKTAGDEPVLLARRAVEAVGGGSNQPSVRSTVQQTLALALMNAGKHQEALDVIRQALTLDPTSGEGRLTEAEAHVKLGDLAQAKSVAAASLRQADAGSVRMTDEIRRRTQEIVDKTSP